jgi:hypothetical protein
MRNLLPLACFLILSCAPQDAADMTVPENNGGRLTRAYLYATDQTVTQWLPDTYYDSQLYPADGGIAEAASGGYCRFQPCFLGDGTTPPIYYCLPLGTGCAGAELKNYVGASLCRPGQKATCLPPSDM